MRTTLVIDDDILAVAKHMAEKEFKTIGEVISSLARQGLNLDAQKPRSIRNGVPLLSAGKGSSPVTMELVNRLRDEQK